MLKIDFTDKKTLEKYSSTFTLSDMEIFIFPELFYPLILANILSPIIWEWRNDPWFYGIEKKSFTYKTNRIKQFIIQNYIFNLDLGTWGLTTKVREIERFKDFFDMELLKKSNALFGYEGDKFYFDLDIRKHFGLDKYDSDIIPYWKTETIEAMTAFVHKENFTTGAGECVSLSALYAAAMFIVGRIPLEKIFLIATPLHSQDFINEKGGIITNNRRIMTRNMWFNGTSISTKARRALENEKITVVSHITGYIHIIHEEATIDKKTYEDFSVRIKEFLSIDLDAAVFINFLRFKSKYKTLFQYKYDATGIQKYILLEKMFEYEHTSKYSVNAESRQSLLKEIEGDEFHLSSIQGKMLLNDFEGMLKELELADLKEIESRFISLFNPQDTNLISQMFEDIKSFIITIPNLPDINKNYIKTKNPGIVTTDSRENILKKITDMAEESELALLTLYTFRQMDEMNWLPFIKASLERNPVSLKELGNKSVEEIMNCLQIMSNQSIYDGNRLALPDEVWNFRRGDGIEKALFFANILVNKRVSLMIKIRISEKGVIMNYDGRNYNFQTTKSLTKYIEIYGRNITIKQDSP
jgi:hypothetical protein